MKIGDYIICIDNSNVVNIPPPPLTLGKVYQIIDIVDVASNNTQERLAVKVICDLGIEAKYYTYRFSLSDRRKNIINDLL